MFDTLDETLGGENWSGFLQGVVSEQLKFRNALKLAEARNSDAVRMAYGTEGQRAGESKPAGVVVPAGALSPAVWLIGGAVVLLVVMMARR